ncbi:DUF4185 domain-containing protein [Amycolatopsis minnesotensis]|uniref:DUF4185 domain-containing protein n=1 Tax=Amycolatopsis minnesotensis TaxID=337894 RepID=A0ABN2SLJ4_9PSEU
MVRVIETTLVGRVTGPGSVSRTDELFGIHGTDLGIVWDGGDGRLFVLFGDTFGEGWGGDGGGPDSADWRCNVLAFSSTRDLANGMTLDGVVRREDGLAAQVIERDPRPDEVTVIPNSGISIDGRQYVHYMSVRVWGPPGRWHTNYGGIAVSEDYGRTWSKPESACWINRAEHDHPFQIGALARDGDHVYLYGTTNGRIGGAHLARASTSDILKANAYEYWTGEGWGRDPFRAAEVLPGNVGELDVAYNVHFGQWMAMHLDDPAGVVRLRTADRPEGPWSDGDVAASGAQFGQLYGGYLHPWSLDGDELYFLLSQWGPYNVFLIKAKLAP